MTRQGAQSRPRPDRPWVAGALLRQGLLTLVALAEARALVVLAEPARQRIDICHSEKSRSLISWNGASCGGKIRCPLFPPNSRLACLFSLLSPSPARRSILRGPPWR